MKKNLPKGYQEQIGFGIITYAVPLAKLPDTYNGEPLCYAGIAAQKNYYSLYLMAAYGNAVQAKWMADEFKKRGKKLDDGEVVPALQVARRHPAGRGRPGDREHADGEIHRDLQEEPRPTGSEK